MVVHQTELSHDKSQRSRTAETTPPTHTTRKKLYSWNWPSHPLCDIRKVREPDRAYEQIAWERVRQAIFAQSQKKAPRPDKLRIPIVQLI